MGALSDEALESVILEQIERVIGDLVKWKDGYFKFEAMEIPDHGEIAVDAREFLAETGFNAHRIAIELSRIADEARRAAASAPRAAAPQVAPPPAAGGPPEERRTGDETAAAPPRESLGGILAARPGQWLTAEASMELLRAGEGFFSRAVLLLVERYGLTGVGQFGVRVGDETVEESIRSLWLPLGGDSLAAEAAAAGRPCRGPLERTDGNGLLVSELGGEWPGEAAALPVKAGPHVVAVLYGDAMPEAAPLPPLDRLEARLAEIGAAISEAQPMGAGQAKG